MKRSIIGVAFLFSFVVTSVAHADTATVPLQDPLTDVIQLWSGIAAEIQSVAQDVALAFEGKGVATSGEPASSAAVVNAFEVPQATSSPSAPQQTTAATTTIINYITNPIERVVDEEPPAPVSFVTQSELAASLRSLSNSLAAQFTPTTTPAFPQYIAGNGNSDVPYAAANNIGQLSNVTISNPTISGGSIPASSITGDITNAINAATGEIDSLTGTGLTYVAATTTDATSTDLYASNLSADTLIASGTTTLSLLDLASLNCATYGNGGKLTTDANGTVVCAADQGGSGSTVGGSDTQVQFNSGGSFTGSSAFTFASSTNLLTVTSASTTNLTASYASTTSFIAGNASSTNFFATNASTTNATSTNLFASLANVTTGIINSVSGNQLTYTAASTTNLSASEGYFSTASTTNLIVSSAPSGFLQTNAQGVVSATSTLSAGSLYGTLGTVNGTALPAGGSITITAASSTLLANSNTFSGNDTFSNAIAGNISGNAGTATSLQNARTINGVSFNGTANITITAASSTLLANNNGWTGLQGFSNATSTLFSATTIWDTGLSNALLGVNASGQLIATSTIDTNLLTGSLGTINGTPFSAGGSITVGSASTTLLADSNTFSGSNSFSNLLHLDGGFAAYASSTVGSGSQNGGLTINGGATTTGNAYFSGNIGISGNIVPSANDTYALGSPSDEWQDVYIGPGSLYVNGEEVVHTDASQNVLVTANTNENIETQTSGTGSILLNPSGTGNIQLAGPVQLTGGDAFTTSNGTPVVFTNGTEPGNLELAGNTIQAVNTNGGISISPNGNGGTYVTSGNVGIGTTSPATTLSVSGSSYLTGGLGVGLLNTAAGSIQTSGNLTINGQQIVSDGSNASMRLISPAGIFLQPANSGLKTDFSSGPGACESGSSFCFNGAGFGIGTTSPSQALSINGNILGAGNLVLQGTLSAQGATFSAPLSLTSTTGTTTIASGQGFTVGGSQFVVQQGSGNVGIGTTSPANLLDIESNASVAGMSVTDSANSSGVAIESRSGYGLLQGLTGSGSPGTLILNAFGGNIGIGTTSPVSTLDVNGTVTVGYQQGINSRYSTGATANLIEVNNGTFGLVNGGINDNIIAPTLNGFQLGTSAAGITGDNGSTNALSFFTNSNEAMRITGSGNVGIGTTSPSTKLEVNGTSQFDNTVTVSEAGDIGLNVENISAGRSANLGTNQGGGWTGLITWNGGHNGQFIEYSDGTMEMYNYNGDALQLTPAGNVYLSGCVTYNGGASGTCLSDERLKSNIHDFTDGLSEIVGLNPVTYQYNGLAGTPNDVADGEVRTGLIAQQVSQVAPDLVATTTGQLNGATTTLYEVNYNDLTFALINAVKEIANISSTFEQNLIAWLGNAQNGIGQFFAQVGNFGQVNTQELCLSAGSDDQTPVCVTKAELAALLSQSATADLANPSPDDAGSNLANPSPANDATDTPPQIQINGDNPAIIQVGATYNDLGATITGPQADLNLGIQTFVNGAPMSPVVIDTSSAATDTVQYVATDQYGLASTSTRTVIIEAPSIIPSDDASTTDEAATTTAATTTTP